MIFRVVIIAICLAGASQAWAMTISGSQGAGGVVGHSEPTRGTGIVNRYDKNAGLLEVDGIAYHYAATAARPVKGAPKELRVGDKVEFAVKVEGDEHWISEINVLQPVNTEDSNQGGERQ